MRRRMKIEHGKNEKKGKAHNFQFHRKEINVYRRIDCGSEATRKRTETENGFQHATARFGRYRCEKLNKPRIPAHAMACVRCRCWLLSMARVGCALVQYLSFISFFVHIRTVLFVWHRLCRFYQRFLEQSERIQRSMASTFTKHRQK